MTLNDIHQYLLACAEMAPIWGMILGIVGLVVSLRTYKTERNKERLEREYGTFDDLDNKYVDFMYACTKHPTLDLFSNAANPNRHISQEELNTERALYSVLISIFERAFVMFERRATGNIKKLQYPGWIECMKSYCTRESFLHEWNKIGTQFDSDFQVLMNKLIKEEIEAGRGEL